MTVYRPAATTTARIGSDAAREHFRHFLSNYTLQQPAWSCRPFTVNELMYSHACPAIKTHT